MDKSTKLIDDDYIREKWIVKYSARQTKKQPEGPAALVETNRGMSKLHLLGRAHRANVRAIAAILALGSVDHVHAALFRDRAFSAFGFAGAAGDAFIRVDLISHG